MHTVASTLLNVAGQGSGNEEVCDVLVGDGKNREEISRTKGQRSEC
jgi:hypothetical protein